MARGRTAMIGIVVLTYQTWEATLECVESIRKTCAPPYRIYAVDNASPNGAYERVREALGGDADVRVIASGRNGGYGFGLNCGARAAVKDGCDAVVLSNNDILYLDGAIEKMYAALLSGPDVALACAQQVTPDGEKFPSAQLRRFSSARVMLWYLPYGLRVREKRGERSLLNASAEVRVEKPLGGCYMMRADILQEIGYYDENIFLYSEEDVIAEKLAKRGVHGVLCPEARVIHHHGLTTGRSMANRYALAAPSILYFGRTYLGWNRWQVAAHRLVFFAHMTAKAIIKPEYRRNYRELLGSVRKG
jgi:GT2 family glycosyltransferase